jgi:hypothetical protein
LTGFLAKQEKDGRLLISDRHPFITETSVAALQAWSTNFHVTTVAATASGNVIASLCSHKC